MFAIERNLCVFVLIMKTRSRGGAVVSELGSNLLFGIFLPTQENLAQLGERERERAGKRRIFLKILRNNF